MGEAFGACMKYFKKIFVLFYKGITRIAMLIRNRFDLIEVKILTLGLGLSALTGLFLLYFLFSDPKLYGVLSSTAIIHLMGGRALGIATCLSAGISPFYTIAYNFLLEMLIVLVTYGITVLFMRNVIQPKLFRSTVRQAELAAQTQKTRIKKYGTIGLFLFVMFPFFMTGPVIGALIGYLLNYKAVNNFIIVLSGTLCSILIYTFAGNKIIQFINQYVPIDDLKRWGAIVIGGLIVVFFIYHMGTVKRFLDQTEDD